jgi:hypothetical protein
LRDQTSRGGWLYRLLILLVSCFPMFVVSCEMRLASQLDSKFERRIPPCFEAWPLFFYVRRGKIDRGAAARPVIAAI